MNIWTRGSVCYLSTKMYVGKCHSDFTGLLPTALKSELKFSFEGESVYHIHEHSHLIIGLSAVISSKKCEKSQLGF